MPGVAAALVLLAFSPTLQAGQPIEIIAHRGASHDAPENTVTAIKLAWDQKADAAEFDVLLSKDGKIVAIHDQDTKRVAGVDRKVVDQTFQELRQLDVGRWKGERFAGERMPTLEELLVTVPPGKRVFIEVKCGPEIVPELDRVIRGSKLKPEQTAVISFKADVIAAIKKARPDLQAYWIVSLKPAKGKKVPSADELIATAAEIRADGLDLSASDVLDEAFVGKVKKDRLKLYVWTVNDLALARRMTAIGVDGITTDRPAWLRQGLAASTGQVPEQTSAKDPLVRWRSGVKVSPVSKRDQHTIHSYFNACPESPDGRWVLCYASATPTGHDGEVRVLERATGNENVLARGVAVEDAHRVACQQWVCGGKQVVFHNLLASGQWVVMAVDLETGRERILARDRQVGFGQPHGSVVPIYGLHWQPGQHRDVELLDVETGAISKTPVTADSVKKTYPEWVSRQFGDGPISCYIPMLSPDLRKLFFKMAAPGGGDFRSREASRREGLLCYDLPQARFLFQHDRWGHPAWHPDSRHIINMPGIVIDSLTGKSRPIPDCPKLPGSHPSFSPDGKLFASDTLAAPFGGAADSWTVGVGAVSTGEFLVLHTFNNSKGARSWRVSHPHPVFSGDGARLYFNVSADDWSRLYVAEALR